MKKMISCMLALVMLLTLAVPAFADSKQGTEIPNIYIYGQGTPLFMEEDGVYNGKTIYDGYEDVPDGFLAKAVETCMPSFLNALRNDDDASWAAYRETFMDEVMPVFGDYFLDNSGESDGAHPQIQWTNASRYGDGPYPMLSVEFRQDWRLDPLDNAVVLRECIEDVIEKTGASKVNLIGRCEGTNIIIAYLDTYGYDYVNCVEFYVLSAAGTDFISTLFSGDFHFDSTALRRFKSTVTDTSDFFSFSDAVLSELIDAVLEFTGSTLLLDVGMAGLQLIAPKIYREVIVYLLRETYARLPGIWSLVGPEYYAAARKGIFSGYEDEFNGLLKKLDHYDTQVRQRLGEIITNAVNGGVKIANFTKYGNYQMIPFSDTNDEINDSMVSLNIASLGATTAKIGKTLTDKYIKDAKKAGTDKYISPDKMVDASTCLLPDTTWFIYGCEHRTFPKIVHDFMLKFLQSDGEMTVFSDRDNAPQYLVYSGELDKNDTLVPMTEENAPTLDSQTIVLKKINWKEMILRFWNAIVNFIKSLIANRAG